MGATGKGGDRSVLTTERKDMKKLHLAAFAAALGFVGVASAQPIDAAPSNLTFRGGVVFPLDDNLREASDLFFGVGIDYLFPNQIIRAGNSETYFSVDWFVKGTSGARGNVFPLAINQRFYSDVSGISRYGRTYFTLGLGAAVIDVNRSATRFLVRGGVGVELGPNVVAEAIATFSDKTRDNVRANALGVYVGYRF